MTVGYNGAMAAALPSRTVANRGVGGQTSTEIAARQGAVVARLTLLGDEIAPSGGVLVTAQSVTMQNAQDSRPITGTLGGVHGTLSKDTTLNSFWFTRSTQGAAVRIAPDEPFIVDTFGKRDWVTVFWVGNNNGLYEPDVAIADVQAMIDFLTPGNDRFVVMALVNGDFGERMVGTPFYDNIIRVNDTFKARWPDHYIDIRSYLISQYDPTNATDVANVAIDILPSSLRADQVHLNAKGNALVAAKVAGFIEAKGW